MSTGNIISPDRTLAVLIGASEWPDAPDFKSSVAFTNSAKKFHEYLLKSFHLNQDNLLDLFDSISGQEEIIIQIEKFLTERIHSLKLKNESFRDLIVYFTGHGGFEGPKSDYYLAIRHTSQKNLLSSAIHIKALANTLKTAAPDLRRFIILDSCFASSAMPAFQGVTDVATIKAKDAFSKPGASPGETIPQSGTTLLCSSSAGDPSIIADDESYTLFSAGLLHVLTNGDRKARHSLTIADIGRLIWQYLSVVYPNKAPRPEVHSPDQADGDIAQIPYFPNHAAEEEASPEKFEPLADTLQCCILLSESEEKSKKLTSDVTGMLLSSYKPQLLKASGKKDLQEMPYVIKVSEAFLSIERYRDTINAMCRATIAIFDVTNYEPAVMFFLGIRSVVRRGISVATAGGNYVIGDTIDFPFNIKEINILSHSRLQSKIKNPIHIMGERIVEGFRQKAVMQDYLDLPTYDAIRNIPVGVNQKRWDWTERVLLLCSFSKHYQENNWAEDFTSFLPVSIQAAVRDVQGIDLPNNKPEIVRTLELKTPRLVSQSLYEAIRLTDMCVVDWTEWKPNVFFELGIRVASNPIEPVCVIDKKHKEFILYNHNKKQGWEPIENPPGLETKTAEILIESPLQCQRLLEWFQPIEYRAVTENSGNDLVAFKNMAAYYDRLRQKRFDLSQPISSLEKDSTYNLVSEAFDTEEEASSRPVYNDMINSANLMSSPDTDSLGISPVLYPRNKLMVQKAGEGALERRIAAWLYIKGRIAKEQIIENENLLSVFTNLGFLIIRGLITSEKRGDTSLFKVIIKENRKLKSAKKSITIKDALEEAKRLKEEAKTYLALARKFKDESLFKDALDVLEDARTLLKKELENPWGAVETNRLLQERVIQVAAEMADCFGIAGGEYRKRKNLPGAIDMYDQGCEYEENPVYAIQNSYNIVNSIVLRITGNLASLESLDTRIKSAIGVVRKQIDTSRERDWWAWADLGLLYVLSQAQDLAIECYRKIRDLGAKEEHLSSISDVLKQLQGQIKESYPDIAEFIQQCIDLLKR